MQFLFKPAGPAGLARPKGLSYLRPGISEGAEFEAGLTIPLSHTSAIPPPPWEGRSRQVAPSITLCPSMSTRVMPPFALPVS